MCTTRVADRQQKYFSPKKIQVIDWSANVLYFRITLSWSKKKSSSHVCPIFSLTNKILMSPHILVVTESQNNVIPWGDPTFYLLDRFQI